MTASSIQGFRAVPIATIRMDSVTDFDIHIQTTPGRPPVLFRERRLPVTPSVIARLAEQRHDRVYIPAAQEKQYRRYITEHIDSILKDSELALPEKCDALYDSAQNLVADILDDPHSRELIAQSKVFVASTVDFMLREQQAFRLLIQLVSYDYHTYTHSVNVSIFSIALAQRLGWTDTDTLRTLGEGTLLHDIGKSMIDPAITLRRGPLDRDQWAAMQMHPIYGYEILYGQEIVGPLVLDIVRHHHEKLDGTGYPDRLNGDRISPLVRVCTIADIFDAMTTRRCYRGAVRTFDALYEMKETMRYHLDQSFFKEFVELMGS